MRVRVVLVEPQEGGNVGAAARVMKNFGWRDLVIAGPAPDAPDEKSVWWAAGAEDVLREVRYVEPPLSYTKRWLCHRTYNFKINFVMSC
jgi:tRNA C32,U32 (ribose-2'-O)-methylase TrmJ